MKYSFCSKSVTFLRSYAMDSDPTKETISKGPSIICYKITDACPEFARIVLKDVVYRQAVLQHELITATIAPEEEELGSFKVHPMIGNAYHYQKLLRRASNFLVSAVEDANTAREIIMFYQIYLDPPVIVTSVEHFLWRCSQEELRNVASMVGFPVAAELVAKQAEKNFAVPIDKMSLIKAIVDASEIVNCLVPSPASEFLKSIRNPNGKTKWYESLTLL